MANCATRPLQLFSPEKLEEFRDMSLKARLISVSYTHLTLPTIYSV